MTIKHTRKDIASEPGDIVLNLNKNTPGLKSNNQNENFKDDLIITLRRQNQYNEVLLEDLEAAAEAQGEELGDDVTGGQDLEPYNDQQTISIPLTQLVRLKYLEANYYTKTDIDERIKIYIHVVDSINDLPAQGQSNYIYLVPFTSEDDDTNDANHPNAYKEYVWTDQNKYELVGSTKVNLSGFMRKSELNAELLNASNFTNLSSAVSTNASAIATLNSHQHGNLTNDGKITTTSNDTFQYFVGVGNSTSSLYKSQYLRSDKVKDINAYANINSSQNDTQDVINGKINTTIGTINTTLATLPNYLLKSEIYDEIWGSAGFRNLQTAEANNSPTKTAKLGDYIYSQVYTKNDIDTLIGTLAQLQQNTLNIL